VSHPSTLSEDSTAVLTLLSLVFAPVTSIASRQPVTDKYMISPALRTNHGTVQGPVLGECRVSKFMCGMQSNHQIQFLLN